MEDHLWSKEKNFGYIQYKTVDDVTNAYIKYAEKLKKLIAIGFSAAVYTQTSDVEIEVYGLVTYDRKSIKVNEERVRTVNLEVCRSLQTK